jgi:hypothetical protein
LTHNDRSGCHGPADQADGLVTDAFLELHAASTPYAWYGWYQSDGSLLRITLAPTSGKAMAPTCRLDSDQN